MIAFGLGTVSSGSHNCALAGDAQTAAPTMMSDRVSGVLVFILYAFHSASARSFESGARCAAFDGTLCTFTHAQEKEPLGRHSSAPTPANFFALRCGHPS